MYTLDTQGEPLGQRLLDSELLSSRLAAISGAPRWWAQPPRPASGPFPQGPTRVVEITDDGSLEEIASLQPGDLPLASLRDGSLLSRRASDRALVRHSATGEPPRSVELHAVSTERELLALERSDGLGVMALRKGFSTIKLMAVDDSGALRWRRTFADGELSMAVDRRQAGGTGLACADPAPRRPPARVRLGGRRRALRGRVRLPADGPAHVAASEPAGTGSGPPAGGRGGPR
jgi:hypothetical protein